jgi:hypothetical protein
MTRLIREDTLDIERRLISDEKWQLYAGDDIFRRYLPLEWPLRGRRERDCELWTRVSPQRGALEGSRGRRRSFQHQRYEAMVIYDPRDEQQSYEGWKWSAIL